jgi:hypothetical protein
MIPRFYIISSKHLPSLRASYIYGFRKVIASILRRDSVRDSGNDEKFTFVPKESAKLVYWLGE